MPRRPPPGPSAPAPPADASRTLIAPCASPQEAAAIVAAIERFVADTAPPPPPRPPGGPGRWLRAALLDGVSRADRRRGAWGDPRP